MHVLQSTRSRHVAKCYKLQRLLGLCSRLGDASLMGKDSPHLTVHGGLIFALWENTLKKTIGSYVIESKHGRMIPCGAQQLQTRSVRTVT